MIEKNYRINRMNKIRVSSRGFPEILTLAKAVSH